jgi:DNA-binding Lrp family transcriptional regulator
VNLAAVRRVPQGSADSLFKDPPLRPSAELDGLDLLLVTALQTTPRADWQRLGQLLGTSASTAARRWARLTQEGLAWQSCHPLDLPGMSPFAALFEIDTAAGQLFQVAAQLAEDPHVFDVIHLTGARDLLVLAGFSDHAQLARYIGVRLAGLDGVIATRAQVATAIHTEASGWRADRLPTRPGAAARSPVPALATGAAPRPPGGTEPDEADLLLMAALSQDPRRPVAEMADRTGLSPTTVTRRLARLQTGRVLAWRCDVARVAAGWPVAAHLWGRVPPDQTAQVTTQLAGMREVRMCASISGPSNLYLTVWLRTLRHLDVFEARLAACLPALAITDRAMSLWHVKLGGHLVDPDGRRIRSIPLRLWPDQPAAQAQAVIVDRLRHGP